MKILRWLLILLVAVIAFFTAGYFYFLHVPEIAKPSLSDGLQRHELSVDRYTRTFNWYKPDNLSKNAPLVFVLHGSGGDGEQIRGLLGYEFDLLADRYGFIVVYPDGYKKHWNDCRKSADYAANVDNVDEIAFFQSMISFFNKEYAIDKSQVFVTGHSNGGHMTFGLAMEAAGLFSAIASVSASLPVEENLDCTPSGDPISVAIFNGTEDPINPFNGGVVEVMGNSSRGDVISSLASAQYWADLIDPPNPPEADKIFPNLDGVDTTSIAERRWLGRSGKQVRHYTLNGSGHVIPSTIARFPRIMGGDARDISGPEEIIGFFMAQSRDFVQRNDG